MDRVPRPETLSALYDLGHDVRAWCFRCARGAILPPHLWERHGDKPIADAARRFACRQCRRSDQVLLLPARGTPVTGRQAAISYFFGVKPKRLFAPKPGRE